MVESLESLFNSLGHELICWIPVMIMKFKMFLIQLLVSPQINIKNALDASEVLPIFVLHGDVPIKFCLTTCTFVSQQTPF